MRGSTDKELGVDVREAQLARRMLRRDKIACRLAKTRKDSDATGECAVGRRVVQRRHFYIQHQLQ